MPITTSFTVSSEGSTTSTSLTDLNGAIASIDVGGTNAATGTSYTIILSQNITLSAGDLLALNLPTNSSVTIESSAGNTFTINGNNAQRGFFVYSGSVTIENLNIDNTV